PPPPPPPPSAARAPRPQPPRRAGQFAPCETPDDAAIVQVARGVARDLGVGGEEVVGVPYGSDLRHLVNAGGTPGILFGPGDVSEAHRENESIGVDELVDGARAVALCVLRFLADDEDRLALSPGI
ncbi:MAG: M20/M25/M40 family metallo-hydrolase, partial [Gemmatimonadetes bacterium]|nr:M20/M25/M40 family metallo-hydrolase [Gemmatimonadota bacterium]